jgi:hypothetical protein
MPFNSQYDRDRVPILTNDEFNPSNAATMSYRGGLDANTANDELFAAALAASISETPDESRYRVKVNYHSIYYNMDIFRTPGNNLVGVDKVQFGESSWSWL